jgi:hypothetical protein
VPDETDLQKGKGDMLTRYEMRGPYVWVSRWGIIGIVVWSVLTTVVAFALIATLTG